MLSILLCYVCFATAIVANKALLSVIPLTILVGLRMFVAGIALIYMERKRHFKAGLTRFKQDWHVLVAIILFTTLAPALFKAYGLKYMISAKASFISSIDPFVTAIYAYFLYSERLSWQKFFGLCIGITGTMILISSTTPVEQTLKAFSIFSYPELATLASVCIGRLGWINVQQQVRSNRYTPREINGLIMLGAGSISLLAAVYYQESFASLLALSPLNMGLLAYSIIVGNMFAYTFLTYMLKKHSATLMSLAGMSVPIMVSVLGYTCLGEVPTWHVIVAGALVLIGLVIFNQEVLEAKPMYGPREEATPLYAQSKKHF